ncbi:N-acetylmuramoyl-L-alanine amidase, partial [Brevibacillus sp. MCWH]|uniref:N-acetylmuramoyl-L-alanine amidase n=1 Tax=Brevibacillus sp. MCWH TaxID=2508871 RepID=UPI00353049B5
MVEKTIALKTAFSVKKTLEEYGVKVVMVRTTDVYVDLSKRPLIANNAGADFFV